MIKIWQFHGENNTEMENEINCWLVADQRIKPIQWLQSESQINQADASSEADIASRITISCVYTRSAQEPGT